MVVPAEICMITCRALIALMKKGTNQKFQLYGSRYVNQKFQLYDTFTKSSNYTIR